jgi:hypothetical protein
MPMLDVCVIGEINLDVILYGLPKELVLDRELLANGLALTLGRCHTLPSGDSRVTLHSRVAECSCLLPGTTRFEPSEIF